MIFESKVLLAFDESSVAAAIVSRGPRGARIGKRAAAPLPQGALVPGPLDDNIASPQDVREALERVHQGLGSNGRRAELILPDGVARLQLLDVPDGVRPDEFARFRLPQGLPFASSEALVDGVAAPPGRFLAGAVRRSVVRGYEAVAAAAGFAQERVDLFPLVALAPLLRRPEPGFTALALALGDTALSLAYFDAGRLSFFRNRRRDRGGDEYVRLRDEVLRTAAMAGAPARPRVLALGSDAGPLAAALREEGFAAEAGYSDAEAAGTDWLASALV